MAYLGVKVLNIYFAFVQVSLLCLVQKFKVGVFGGVCLVFGFHVRIGLKLVVVPALFINTVSCIYHLLSLYSSHYCCDLWDLLNCSCILDILVMLLCMSERD